jgi:hypothetical protein
MSAGRPLEPHEIASQMVLIGEAWALPRGYTRAEGIASMTELLAKGAITLYRDAESGEIMMMLMREDAPQ